MSATALEVTVLLATGVGLTLYVLLGTACAWLLIQLARKPRDVDVVEEHA